MVMMINIKSIEFIQSTFVILPIIFSISGWPGEKQTENTLWELAEKNTPIQKVANYNQAMMDMGAIICTRSKPKCSECPLEANCMAHSEGDYSSYPGKKPKKKIPVRNTRFYLFKQGTNILLEQRPPAGIWGGLWSFIENIEVSEAEVAAEHGFKVISSRQLDPFRHTFSHFHLDIEAVLVEVEAGKASQVNENQQIWYNLNNPPEVGLAAPTKKLLDQLSLQELEQLSLQLRN